MLNIIYDDSSLKITNILPILLIVTESRNLTNFFLNLVSVYFIVRGYFYFN